MEPKPTPYFVRYDEPLAFPVLGQQTAHMVEDFGDLESAKERAQTLRAAAVYQRVGLLQSRHGFWNYALRCVYEHTQLLRNA